MPTYTYRCQTCGVEFDRVQKFSDSPLTHCPECDGSVKRVPQASAVVFKGSGWYITDSKKSSSATSTAPAAKKEEAAPAKTETSTPAPAAPATPAASSD